MGEMALRVGLLIPRSRGAFLELFLECYSLKYKETAKGDYMVLTIEFAGFEFPDCEVNMSSLEVTSSSEWF